MILLLDCKDYITVSFTTIIYYNIYIVTSILFYFIINGIAKSANHSFNVNKSKLIL